ncbi:MAG TPA: IPT/TIG domain-containing protein [Pyrinomonadaceae bacterium]|nr:IPT/TIG domain-containing protein [Pyrinomonadaceae bacterium]
MRIKPGVVRLTLVIVIFGLFIYFYFVMARKALMPYGWGAVALVFFWAVTWILTGRLNPFSLVIGEDGRPSTSKLKPFLWTVVMIFAYAALYSAKLKKGSIDPISNIPANLLIAIGLDVATLVAAKGITESQIASGQVEKPPPITPTTATTVAATANAGPGAVFQDDNGFPELTKIQTITWTGFAIVLYFVAVDAALKIVAAAQPGSPAVTDLSLPDIAPAMMVLIGLGNAAYLGKKLVTTDTPVLTAISVDRSLAFPTVTLTGVAFGAIQNGSRITLDEKEIIDPPLEWSNERVKFKLPDKNPNGGDWIGGQTVRIGLFVKGRTTNQLPLTIAPFLSKLDPLLGSANTEVKITGAAFGPTPEKVTIDNIPLDASIWTSEEIKFKIPPKHPNGKDWTPNQSIAIGVTVQKQQSNTLPFKVS